MNVFLGHPLQPDLSDCKSIRFIPYFPGIDYLHEMIEHPI